MPTIRNALAPPANRASAPAPGQRAALRTTQFTEAEARDSGAAFFFLVLYTACVLIRPQEIFPALYDVPIVQTFAILSFTFLLIMQRPLLWNPVQWMLLLLLPIVAVSGFANGWGTKGVREAQQMLIASNIPLFLYVTIISTVFRQKLVMYISVIASIAMIHNGWVQAHNDFGWTGTPAIKIGDEIRIRYLGFFNDPNDLGMLIVMNLPILAFLYHRGGKLQRLVCIATLSWFCYGIYLTGSRGTIVSASALLGVFLLLKYGGTRLIIAGLALGPSIATLLAQFGGLSASESSARSRLDAWYHSIQYLIANPVLGIGKDNFVDMHGRTAHNSFVLVAAELGVPGYTLWGGALALTLYIGYRVFKLPAQHVEQHHEPAELQEELAINSTMFFSLLGFIFAAFFLSRSYTLLMYLFLGLALASHHRMIKLLPELRYLMSARTAVTCSLLSWSLVVMVWLTMKVSLA